MNQHETTKPEGETPAEGENGGMVPADDKAAQIAAICEANNVAELASAEGTGFDESNFGPLVVFQANRDAIKNGWGIKNYPDKLFRYATDEHGNEVIECAIRRGLKWVYPPQFNLSPDGDCRKVFPVAEREKAVRFYQWCVDMERAGLLKEYQSNRKPKRDDIKSKREPKSLDRLLVKPAKSAND